MEIQIFKLVTGETIIAESGQRSDMDEFAGIYTIDKPFSIIVTQEGIALMPFDMFGKAQSIEIKNDHILFVTDPDPEILNVYKSQTGGIVTPTLGIATD